MKFCNARAALCLLVLGSLLPLTFAASALAAQAPVPLGGAGNFAILSGAGITDPFTSVISGDVGVSPITGASITGLGCAEVTGTIYAVDALGQPCFINDPGLLTTAKIDLGNAFDNATAQTPTASITGLNLAGMTLGAGVYNATGGILISGPGALTLDGGGNADSVFIFQAAAAENLTVDNDARVVYTNGAQPCNVFWKVQSAFLSNTGFGFVGTILASTQITLTSNITVEGRLLASTTNVTLISDTITRPSSCVLQADIDAAAAEAARIEAEAAAAEAARVAAAAEAARIQAAAAETATVVTAAADTATVVTAAAETATVVTAAADTATVVTAAADTATVVGVAAEAVRVEAVSVEVAAASRAVSVEAAKVEAARRLVVEQKAAAAKKPAATKRATAPKAGPTGGSTSVGGPALPPVNPHGFTG